MNLSNTRLGIPSSAIREIALLKVLKHDNIMAIEEIQHNQENLFIVAEYCSMDLKNYFDTLEDMIPPRVIWIYCIEFKLSYLDGIRLD